MKRLTPNVLAGLTLAALALPGVVSAQEDELAQIRQATARFQTVEEAEAAGYELGYVNGSGERIVDGCVAIPDKGGMGYHYINKVLMDDLLTDPLHPEALVFAPMADGSTRLVAVEYIVRGENSDPPGLSTPPEVLGHPKHIIVPAVGWYTQHAWVWEHNPAGVLADWNPWVTCRRRDGIAAVLSTSARSTHATGWPSWRSTPTRPRSISPVAGRQGPPGHRRLPRSIPSSASSPDADRFP